MGPLLLDNDKWIFVCVFNHRNTLEYSILVYKIGKIVFTIFTIFAQKNPICVTNLRVLKILVKIRSLVQCPCTPSLFCQIESTGLCAMVGSKAGPVYN